jgi:hypothetical protein
MKNFSVLRASNHAGFHFACWCCKIPNDLSISTRWIWMREHEDQNLTMFIYVGVKPLVLYVFSCWKRGGELWRRECTLWRVFSGLRRIRSTRRRGLYTCVTWAFDIWLLNLWHYHGMHLALAIVPIGMCSYFVHHTKNMFLNCRCRCWDAIFSKESCFIKYSYSLEGAVISFCTQGC